MNQPFVIGLTGSIGMGKSTTADMFVQEGIPVWDADAAVHRIYATGGAAVEPLKNLHPAAIQNGAVDRSVLKNWISKDPSALSQIEQIVHPLVASDRAMFLKTAETDIVLLDIPLLFETGADEQVDLVVVASVSEDIQHARVMARGTMTEDQFRAILSKQIPDAEKRARADFVIPTDTLDGARAAVKTVISEVKRQLSNA